MSENRAQDWIDGDVDRSLPPSLSGSVRDSSEIMRSDQDAVTKKFISCGCRSIVWARVILYNYPRCGIDVLV